MRLRARGVDEVSADELARLAKGRAVGIDVPRLEYESGHIAGARSIPIDDLGSV